MWSSDIESHNSVKFLTQEVAGLTFTCRIKPACLSGCTTNCARPKDLTSNYNGPTPYHLSQRILWPCLWYLIR